MAAAVTVSVRLVAVALGRRLPCVRVRGSRTLEWLAGPVGHGVPVRVLYTPLGLYAARQQAEQLRGWGYRDVEIEEDR